MTPVCASIVTCGTSVRLCFKYCCCLLLVLSLLAGCSRTEQGQTVVTVWHQMTVGERELLAEQVTEFEKDNPKVQINAVYKETEQLRSSFQAASLAGIGPDLIFGPSDPLGTFVTMGLVQDMSPWFGPEEQSQFIDKALTFVEPSSDADSEWLVQVGDRVGNHLALVYNRNLIAHPPKTTEEMVAMAIQATRMVPAFGESSERKQYGLVWNFVEPFFLIPFLTGHGAWVFEEGSVLPNLDSPECVAALTFVAELQEKHQVMPINCDYETADSLFKEGAAAMIINGDWSWSQYLENKKIDAAVVPLPVVSSTGLPMGPMVATKGYSINAHTRGSELNAAVDFIRFVTSPNQQRQSTERLKTLPSRRELYDDPDLLKDPTLAASSQQMANGYVTPVAPELRAVWDAMRPPYQELLSGAVTPKEAAGEMQMRAIDNIETLNSDNQPTKVGAMLRVTGWLLFASLIIWQRKNWGRFVKDVRKQPFSYALIFPALLVIGLTIIYPFIYNVILSFSNMSLRNFQEWQVTGFQNYAKVLTEEKFFIILLKTIIWTVVCVFFHVTIGLLLAVCLNGPIRGKSIYRVMLILPWAIPAYITALTWRGMFNFEYGAINLMLTQWLGVSEGLNWLGDEYLAFTSCIIANVWLGFPFMMVIALGGMQGIPAELYEAARMDRVSRWKQFRNITLPMLKPVLIPAMTLGAIWTFNNLNVIWLVTNSGEPADKTHILVSYVYKAVFNLYQYGYGAALSMLIFFMLLAFSIVFLKRTEATEGV